MTAPLADADDTAAVVGAVNAIADDIEAGVGRTDAPAYSLAFGDAGVALLFGALARAGCRPGADVRAEDFLRNYLFCKTRSAPSSTSSVSR